MKYNSNLVEVATDVHKKDGCSLTIEREFSFTKLETILNRVTSCINNFSLMLPLL